MSIPEKPRKAVVSVVEMADMLDLSKSRFYALVQTGIFPQAIRHPSGKRPVYDLELQQKCLDIRHSGIGANGQPVLFNRKAETTSQKQRRNPAPVGNEQGQLIDALKSLGLQTNAAAVATALRELYPNGTTDMDQGEIVRQIFLHLQNRK